MTKQARAARLQAPKTIKRSHLLTVKSLVSQGTSIQGAYRMHHTQHLKRGLCSFPTQGTREMV